MRHSCQPNSNAFYDFLNSTSYKNLYLIAVKSLFLLLFLFANKCWCQDDLRNGLQKIFTEAENEFRSFRGPIKNVSKSGDTIYSSNFTLQDTYDPEIERSSETGWNFSCTLATTNEKGAKIVVDKWKKRLASALEKDFMIKKIDTHYSSASAKGYYFTGHNVEISLFYTILEKGHDFSVAHLIIKRS